MTQNDFLAPLFSLHPLVVAAIVFAAGGGFLFLFAGRINFAKGFLRQPQFVVGDLLMLPLVGFLITFFYQRVDNPIDLVISTNWTYVTLLIALVLSALSAYRSFFVIKTMPINIFIFAHLIFYFFMAYILLSFFPKGMLQLLSDSTPLLWIVYIGVVIATATHLMILPAIFGFKKFPR